MSETLETDQMDVKAAKAWLEERNMLTKDGVTVDEVENRLIFSLTRAKLEILLGSKTLVNAVVKGGPFSLPLVEGRVSLSREVLLNLVEERVSRLKNLETESSDQKIIRELESNSLIMRAFILGGNLEGEEIPFHKQKLGIEFNPNALYVAYKESGLDESDALELSKLAANGRTYYVARDKNGHFKLPKNLVSLTNEIKRALETQSSFLAVA